MAEHLSLDSSSRNLLTAETKQSDGTIVSRYADLQGNVLPTGMAPLLVLVDPVSKKRYARICAVKPSQTDPISMAMALAIEERNPEFFPSDDGSVRGWYVPVDDFSYHPEQPGTAAAAGASV